jgi:hypothetical protein
VEDGCNFKFIDVCNQKRSDRTLGVIKTLTIIVTVAGVGAIVVIVTVAGVGAIVVIVIVGIISKCRNGF